MAQTSIPKVVTQYLGRWDNFNSLIALHERALLSGFCTDFWLPDSKLSQHLLSLAPRQIYHRLIKTLCPVIPSELAHVDYRAFWYTFLIKTRHFQAAKAHRIFRIQGEYLGRATQRLAHDNNADAVFAYSYYAAWTFDNLDPQIKRLMFQVHPYAPAIQAIYERILAMDPPLGHLLLRDSEMGLDPEFAAALEHGPRMADKIFANSEFSRRTLMDSGLSPDKVSVIPLGADLERFAFGSGPPTGRPRILYLGNVIGRKGIGILLEAWKRLKPRSAELIIAGSIADDRPLHHALGNSSATVLGRVDDAMAVQLFQTSSLFCMPSLIEGFGLVYLQSLSCGTPVVGTENTVVPDICRRNPSVGFVTQAGSVDSLAATLEFVLSRPRILNEARTCCRTVAHGYTWEAYRQQFGLWLEAALNNGDAFKMGTQ